MGNRNQQSNNFIQAYNIDLIPDNADSKNIASPTHLNAFNKLVETLTTHANRQETCIGFPQAGSVQEAPRISVQASRLCARQETFPALTLATTRTLQRPWDARFLPTAA